MGESCKKKSLKKGLSEGIAKLYCTILVLQVKWVNMQLFYLIPSDIDYFARLPGVAKSVCVLIAPSVLVNLTPFNNILLVVDCSLNLLLCSLVVV